MEITYALVNGAVAEPKAVVDNPKNETNRSYGIIACVQSVHLVLIKTVL